MTAIQKDDKDANLDVRLATKWHMISQFLRNTDALGTSALLGGSLVSL